MNVFCFFFLFREKKKEVHQHVFSVHIPTFIRVLLNFEYLGMKHSPFRSELYQDF